MSLAGDFRGIRYALFHEAVLLLDRPVAAFLAGLSQQGILGGYDLGKDYPELGNALLVCATEQRSAADIEYYIESARQALEVAA